MITVAYGIQNQCPSNCSFRVGLLQWRPNLTLEVCNQYVTSPCNLSHCMPPPDIRELEARRKFHMQIDTTILSVQCV